MDYEFIKKQYTQRPKVDQDYEFNDTVRIGRGSYGQVYKAIQKKTIKQNNINPVRYYALKEVEMSSYSPSTCRELALYREINHRNVMNLLAVYLSYSKQKAWLLFDYAEYDLNTIIKFYRNAETLSIRMPEVLQKSCLYQTLTGLKYLHDSWILHRDLKPENILVMGGGSMRGCIKITDMGMARTFHSPLKPLAEVDTVVCTSWYRAPELLLGSRHYTKAVDLFSFGCIMAEMLTNMPIFASSPDGNPQPHRSPYIRCQLEQIFKVLGYPTVSSWPEIRQLPEYERMLSDFKRNSFNSCTLAKYMKRNAIDSHSPSFDLLSNLMLYDPKKRISSIDALHHPYFGTEPIPSADAFSCFDKFIPFPNRKFLASNSNQTVNGNQFQMNSHQFLSQPNENLSIIQRKIVQSKGKFQSVTRVTRRTYLQERNF